MVKIKLLCNHTTSENRSKEIEQFKVKKHEHIYFVYNNEKPDYYIIENHPFFKGKNNIMNQRKQYMFIVNQKHLVIDGINGKIQKHFYMIIKEIGILLM